MSEPVFVTDDLKTAAALASAGFEPVNAEMLQQQTGERCIVEIKPKAHGLKANHLNDLSLKGDESEIVEIIERRGITPAEYARIVFDAARAGCINRASILKAARDKAPLVAKQLGDGTLIYRVGTPKTELKKLINHVQR